MPKERKVVIQDGAQVASTPSTPNGHVLNPKTLPGEPDPPKFKQFDPNIRRLISDRLYQSLSAFKWSDRQQHGRLVYDSMMKHSAVSSCLNTLVSFLKSYRPLFKPAGLDPTARQKEFAAFANEQLRRLSISGDGRQGYEKMVEWFGQGLRYGFSVAEMETVRAPWGGQSRVQIQRLLPLPQASLDHGFTPLEEFGQGITPNLDVRYDCFELAQDGQVVSFKQYGHGSDNKPETITWSGNDLLRLLIYTHGGGEGNPYGESILYSAFYHWASLYTLEQMEEAMLDAGLPYLTVSYKTPDGRPSPALHAQFLEVIKQQDPAVRALIMPDATFGSMAPSNPAFTEHAGAKKQELRDYIRNAIFGAPLTGAGREDELDARNLIAVFFGHLLPGLQREIATLLSWQFARRLIDANWSNVSSEEYPELVFNSVQDDNLRVATPLLQQVLPFVDSERLGELLQSTIKGFDANWIPKDASNSVSAKRGAMDPAASAKPTPPPKQQGSPDTKLDGSSQSVGQKVSTAV